MTEKNLAPGVSIERRLVLGLPLLFLEAQRTAMTPEGDGFTRFTSSLRSLAEELLEEKTIDPDEYLLRLASFGARLGAADVPVGKLGRFASYDPPIELGPIHRDPPLALIQWRFAPGAVLPPHNHTPGHVLSLCIEGECRVRHFDVIGKAPSLDSKETFRVRETENRILRAGRSTSLTPDRDNIHTFEAGPQGALGFDVNTIIPGDGDWSMLEIDDRPVRDYDRLFEARWIGKPA